jgi:hypothetical protein
MAFGHTVAFEAILISALFLAHLAVPPELLEAFGFDAIGNRFGSEEVMFAHPARKN